MPQFTFTNNTYAGEALAGFMASTLLEADSVKRGLLTVINDVKSRKVILDVDDDVVLQDPSGIFADQGTTSLQNESYLDPVVYEFMKQEQWDKLVQSWEAQSAYLFLILLVVLNYLFKLNISSGSFFTSAFYIKNLHFNSTSDWYSAHFWTLSIEEQFYIIFPLFLIYKLDNYVKVTYFLVLVIPILQFLGYNNVGIFYSNYAIHKSVFLLINLFGNGSTSILIGSLLSILMFKGLLLAKNLKINHLLSFVIFVIAIIFRVTCIDLVDSTYFTSTIFSIAIALVIFLCLINKGDFLCRLLRNKILTKFGVLSYSLYIWQQIFLYKQPWANSFKYADSLFLNIPALFIVAYLSYHFYELKFLKLKEKFKSVGYNIDKKVL